VHRSILHEWRCSNVSAVEMLRFLLHSYTHEKFTRHMTYDTVSSDTQTQSGWLRGDGIERQTHEALKTQSGLICMSMHVN
jgi:hypothetical protein